jgi:amidase
VVLAELARLDAHDQAALVARGELSAGELFAAFRERLDALNPLLRAVVAHADAPPPALPGPLAGVPFLVKDSLPWPGLRWAMGSRAFSGQVPRSGTRLTRRIAASGLVGAGKTALSEFGLLPSTETLLEGVTHHPWDLSLSAGGSSGGSAVAVAAGLVPLAHANDGGGSIRIPASFAGVFGFKPSRGRTQRASHGDTAFEDLVVEHCVTRSVRDSALFLSLIEDDGAGERIGFVREPLNRPLRVALLERAANGDEPAPAVLRVLRDSAELLEDLGHRIEPVTAPATGAEALGPAVFLLAGATIAGIVERLDRSRGVPVQEDELEPFTWGLLARFEQADRAALELAQETLARAGRAYRSRTDACDVVLTPVVATEPWPLGFLSPLLKPDELIRRVASTNAFAPLANITGAPAMSVPLGESPGGLPIGVQLSAAPGADALLLGLAYQLEAARPWRDRWPPYSIPGLAK